MTCETSIATAGPFRPRQAGGAIACCRGRRDRACTSITLHCRTASCLPPPLNVVGRLARHLVRAAGHLVMVGSSNAVNLTDGLDGLAGGCMLFAAAAMTLVVYAAGHAQWAAYLQRPARRRLRRTGGARGRQ